jgi:hypothetical protein
MLSMILPASALGFRCKGAQDAFDKELVCVHIFQPGFKIPEPLWEQHDSIPIPKDHSDLFTLKIPELIFCTTEKDFLSIFEYFWPIERSEFDDTIRKVNIEYEKLQIAGKSDVSEFSRYLENIDSEKKSKIKKTTIIYTLNDVTRYFVADFLNLWQTSGIYEFVLFKDPSKSPYLCSYPSLQKGFKRPPPISSVSSLKNSGIVLSQFKERIV